jgi:hypothetical protein
MSNMSYCRFENTASDLSDCLDAIGDTHDLSEYEWDARKRLIALCHRIIEYTEDEDQNEVYPGRRNLEEEERS